MSHVELIETTFNSLKNYIYDYNFADTTALLNENNNPFLAFIVIYNNDKAGYLAFYQNKQDKTYIELKIKEKYQNEQLGLCALYQLKYQYQTCVDYHLITNDFLIPPEKKRN